MFEVEEIGVVVVHQFMVGVGGEVIREKEVRLPKRKREEEVYSFKGKRKEEVYPFKGKREEEVYLLEGERKEEVYPLKGESKIVVVLVAKKAEHLVMVHQQLAAFWRHGHKHQRYTI